MAPRTARAAALAVPFLAALAAAGCAGMGGTVTDTVDAADPEARTILVGGKTVHVSDDFRFDTIMVGSRYRVLYDRVDGRYYATGVEEVGTTNTKSSK
jgi:hypothetical protein